MLKRIFHGLTHILGTNTGKVASWQDDNYIYVGFECSCGKIDPKTIEKIESNLIYDRASNNSDSEYS